MPHTAYEGDLVVYQEALHHKYYHVVKIDGQRARITEQGALVIIDGPAFYPAKWEFFSGTGMFTGVYHSSVIKTVLHPNIGIPGAVPQPCCECSALIFGGEVSDCQVEWDEIAHRPLWYHGDCWDSLAEETRAEQGWVEGGTV